MNFDWQAIAVALIVAAAVLYVGRRGWARVRSMRGGGRTVAVSDCGSCCDEKPAAAAAPQAKFLVQIGRSRDRPAR